MLTYTKTIYTDFTITLTIYNIHDNDCESSRLYNSLSLICINLKAKLKLSVDLC